MDTSCHAQCWVCAWHSGTFARECVQTRMLAGSGSQTHRCWSIHTHWLWLCMRTAIRFLPPFDKETLRDCWIVSRYVSIRTLNIRLTNEVHTITMYIFLFVWKIAHGPHLEYDFDCSLLITPSISEIPSFLPSLSQNIALHDSHTARNSASFEMSVLLVRWASMFPSPLQT